MTKPTLCIDFDGVIHDYKEGWKNGEIYGNITKGFFEWASDMVHHFKLVVYSSRSKDVDMRMQMYGWFKNEWAIWAHSRTTQYDPDHEVSFSDFEFAHEKPSAFMTIDDRCICFDGDWSKITPDAIFNFKPWNKS